MTTVYKFVNEQNDYKELIKMETNTRKTRFTTIGIDGLTHKLIEKLCKRYSLKKGEISGLQ